MLHVARFGPEPTQGDLVLLGAAEGERRYGHRPDQPRVLPEEAGQMVWPAGVHPVGGVDSPSGVALFAERGREAGMSREGRRSAHRESPVHHRGDEQARIPSEDAEPIGARSDLRHLLRGRAALPLQAELRLRPVRLLLDHQHHEEADQGHVNNNNPIHPGA